MRIFQRFTDRFRGAGQPAVADVSEDDFSWRLNFFTERFDSSKSSHQYDNQPWAVQTTIALSEDQRRELAAAVVAYADSNGCDSEVVPMDDGKLRIMFTRRAPAPGPDPA